MNDGYQTKLTNEERQELKSQVNRRAYELTGGKPITGPAFAQAIIDVANGWSFSVDDLKQEMVYNARQTLKDMRTKGTLEYKKKKANHHRGIKPKTMETIENVEQIPDLSHDYLTINKVTKIENRGDSYLMSIRVMNETRAVLETMNVGDTVRITYKSEEEAKEANRQLYQLTDFTGWQKVEIRRGESKSHFSTRRGVDLEIQRLG